MKKFTSPKKNKKEKKKLIEFNEKRHLIKPFIIVVLLIVLQVFLLIYLYRYFGFLEQYIASFWGFLVFIMIVYFVNLDKPMDYKLSWLIPISLLPVFGILLYLILDILPGPKQLTRRLNDIISKNKHILKQDPKVHESIKNHPSINHGLENYISEYAKYPMYQNTDAKYFPTGEEFFDSLKEDLRNAENFILIEYFIVKPGRLLSELLEILVDKIEDGVEVLFMYDGSNEYHLPTGYKSYLEKLGIKVGVFAAVKPILSTAHNNRDHRKIVSIDNKIAYTGGVNIADEYVNYVNRFGYWKDNGIRIKGEAVRNITTMFFYLWNLGTQTDYVIDDYVKDSYKVYSQAYVQPFSDSPNDGESVSENTYLDVLSQAKDYVYILSPYLVPSETINNALKFAAKRGVDVRIFLPGIEDKKIPYAVGRSYYKHFIEAGVKIYEYTPGFLHSKAIVSDDMTSVVGTINLDYRSFNLNYENAILIYDKNFALSVKEDVLSTLDKSRHIGMKEYKKLNIFYKLFGKIMRLFAPLM